MRSSMRQAHLWGAFLACCGVALALPAPLLRGGAASPPTATNATSPNATERHLLRAGAVRLLHGSGYLPQNTLVPYWGRYAAEGMRVGMILNGVGGMAAGEASFASRARQMSTAMSIPEGNFVFIPLFGDLCPEMANSAEVAELIMSCDAVYMPGGNQGMLAACIYGVVSDSGVDDPQDTLAARALRTLELVGGDSAGAMNQPSGPMMSRHDDAWTICSPCDECCGESYCALTNGCVFTRDTGNKLVEDKMMIHTHVAERGRQGFLLVSIMMHRYDEHEMTKGIGADEGAALYCNNLDKWCDTLADTGRGVWIYVNVEGDTERTTASMHFLSNGDRWNSVTNEVEFAANKVPCNPLAEVLGSQTIFSSGVANDYRRVALEASRLSQPGATVENTHGSTFGAAPVYANFVTTPETVAMCDEDGEQGFSNLGTIQGFIAPNGWKPDLTHKLPLFSDYAAEILAS